MQYLLHVIYDTRGKCPVGTAAANFLREQGHQFFMWWDRLTEEDRRIYALLAARRGPVSKTEVVQAVGPEAAGRGLRVLCHTGVVRKSPASQRYRIAGLLFQSWFKSEKFSEAVRGRDAFQQASGVRVTEFVQPRAGAPDGSAGLRIVHLTDLHFTGGLNANTLVQPLLTDVERLGFSKADFLVMSGDFSDRCDVQGFDTAARFVEALLRAGLVMSPDRLILAPSTTVL